MVINQKRKGSDWEREAVKVLQEKLNGSWKRIAGSGALGTQLEEPLLGGDIVGKLKFVPKSFRLEAKVGYGGAKQFAIKKEWLDKIRKEADATFSIPALVCKFSGAKGDGRHFVVLDLDAFVELILFLDKLSEELNEVVWKTQLGSNQEKK